MSKTILEIKELNKSFGTLRAVRDVSFSVKEGELFAFLGVNGAGKSTTISMICGELKKDGGSIFIDGTPMEQDADRLKRLLGVVFQQSVLDRPLSVRENLESRAALYGLCGEDFENRLKELDELFGLKELLERPLGKLSGGQRRKIDIARALLHRPKLLILDEPTTGLDPQTRKTVWGVIEHLRKTENMTVLLTTHYMEEAAEADFVVILDNGQVVAEGTPLELKNRYTGDFITLYGVTEEQAKGLGYPCEKIPDAWRVRVPNPAAATKLILSHADVFFDYEITKGKMDDVFLSVTGKALNDVDEEKKRGGKRK